MSEIYFSPIGYLFFLNLRKSLIPNQQIGDYQFTNWLDNGNLQFRINESQAKSIPAELLMLAYHINLRNARVQQPTSIDIHWLNANGHSDWCFVEVINYLIIQYNHNI